MGAWLYFTGRVVNMTSEATSLSVRFAYKGQQVILVRTLLFYHERVNVLSLTFGGGECLLTLRLASFAHFHRKRPIVFLSCRPPRRPGLPG